jgi:hypothetical protein
MQVIGLKLFSRASPHKNKKGKIRRVEENYGKKANPEGLSQEQGEAGPIAGISCAKIMA